MKKFLLFVLITFATAKFNDAISATGQFVISGNIVGLPDSTMVYISRPGQQEMLSTAYSKKGKFVLLGNVEGGDVYHMSFIGFTDIAELFITPGKLTLTGSSKALKNVTLTGTSAQQDYKIYLQKFDGLKNRLSKLVGQINQTQPGPQRDSMIMQFEVTKKGVLDQVDLFVKTKPSSLVTPFLVYVTSPMSSDIDALEVRYNAMKPSIRESFYGKEIFKSIAASKIGLEGTQAVDFTQNDTADLPVSLSSFKGKYVLVDFWASWCGPCRAENPNVVNAYNTFKDKNFTVLGISLDQNKEKWINAIHADNLMWTQLSDLKSWQNAVAQLYRIQSIPANMLLDPTGKIIGKNLRGAELFEKLNNILK